MKRSTVGWVLAVGLVAGFIYLRSQVGDQAALNLMFFFAGIVVGAVLMALGSRQNDANQRALIDMMRYTKQAMTASVREEARTQGAYERQLLRMQGQPHPQALPSELQDWVVQEDQWCR